MAGLMPKIIDNQRPYVSAYTDALLQRAEEEHGVGSSQYRGIYNQYYRMPSQELRNSLNGRHYEAEMTDGFPNGLERLYRRVVVIDLLTACASECVYCLRGYYKPSVLSNGDVAEIAEYLAGEPELREVLITGGDPFVSAKKLKQLLSRIVDHAPNIRKARIGTRFPVQSPEKFDGSLYEYFAGIRDRIDVEIGCQINHPYELQPASREILAGLQSSGCRIYSQNVLLKGVNDSLPVLLELYDELRYLGVIPHYLFHAIPLKGTDEFRTTVDRGLDLAMALTSSGEISGLAKPMFSLMTDIGKVTLYDSCVQGREGDYLRIRTAYRLSDRLRWNSSYQLPETASINEDGTMNVLYLDGAE